MLADNGISLFFREDLTTMSAFLGNSVPHVEIGMQFPYKMLHGTEPDVRLLRAISTSNFVHVEPYMEKLELKGWKHGG